VLGLPIKPDTFDQPRLKFDVASRLECHHPKVIRVDMKRESIVGGRAVVPNSNFRFHGFLQLPDQLTDNLN
jgi:hypothetical protein